VQVLQISNRPLGVAQSTVFAARRLLLILEEGDNANEIKIQDSCRRGAERSDDACRGVRTCRFSQRFRLCEGSKGYRR
jgi:hypothetical protein